MKLHSKARLLTVCTALTFLSCEEELHRTDRAEDAHICADEECFVEGVANVMFSEETAQEIEEGSITPGSLGFTSLERLFPDTGKYEERKRREGLHRWYKAAYTTSGPETKSVSELKGADGVEIFVPVRNARLSSFFNDPKSAGQWHYLNDGKTSDQFAAGADINVETVWQDYTTGNRSVIVAVVDQGLDYNHEDLAANYVGGHNFVTGGKVTADDHGSHVAGTIAAVNNNGTGVSGVAGGNALEGVSGVGILSCQIFSGSKGTQHSPEALVWAADNGAVIANNSWGYVFQDSEASKKATIDADLKAAIDYFIRYAGCDDDGNQLPDSPMKGGVVIFAAGNDSWDSNPICAYEPVISVGAIGPDYSRAYYSNYGDWVDISAPGGTAKVTSGQILSTLASNKYGEMQGTSMACPHVSGVAALIVSYHGGQGFTNEMLKERLLGGTRKDVLPLAAKIGPLVDALGSITYGGTIAPEKVTEYELNAIGNKMTVTLAVTEDKDDVKPYEYIVLVSKTSAQLEGADLDSLPEEVIMKEYRTGHIPVGKTMDLTVKGLEFEASYYVRIAARDYAGNMSGWSEIKAISTGANNPPVIVAMQDTNNLRIRSHQSLTVPFNIYDPEGEELSVSLSGGLSGSSIKRAEGGIWNLVITAAIANPGVYSGELIATDIENQSSVHKIGYEILPNSSPVKVKEIGDLLSHERGKVFEFELSEYFSDPDEEQLTYKVKEGNKMIAKATLDGSVLRIETAGNGITSVIVSASDTRKAVAEMEIRVAVTDSENKIDIYPVPVKDILYVRTGQEKHLDISISTMTGQSFHEEKDLVSSMFEPAAIDASQWAPGRYKVIISLDGEHFEKVITKI